MTGTQTKERVEQIIYLHHCHQCNKRWTAPKKISDCPRCGHPHICQPHEFCLKD